MYTCIRTYIDVYIYINIRFRKRGRDKQKTSTSYQYGYEPYGRHITLSKANKEDATIMLAIVQAPAQENPVQGSQKALAFRFCCSSWPSKPIALREPFSYLARFDRNLDHTKRQVLVVRIPHRLA